MTELEKLLLEGLEAAEEIVGWVSMTRYEREACQPDFDKMYKALRVGREILNPIPPEAKKVKAKKVKTKKVL
jgi:hypothetical protein